MLIKIAKSILYRLRIYVVSLFIEFILANNRGKKKLDGHIKKATAVIKRIKKAPSNLARSQTPQRSMVNKGRRKSMSLLNKCPNLKLMSLLIN